MLAGFIVLMIACLFQGSFGLGMKNYRPFSWEDFWIIFSVIGILSIPILWTGIEVPGFLFYIPGNAHLTWVLAIAAACGFLWGISAIWYGKDIDSIGLSLTIGTIPAWVALSVRLSRYSSWAISLPPVRLRGYWWEWR